MISLWALYVSMKGLIYLTDEKVYEITAKEVTVEVRDEKTGEVYRRSLPIDYFENANGLFLRGENWDGSYSQLAFYSARGLERMKGLTGKGPNEDPCGSHKNS